MNGFNQMALAFAERARRIVDPTYPLTPDPATLPTTDPKDWPKAAEVKEDE